MKQIKQHQKRINSRRAAIWVGVFWAVSLLIFGNKPVFAAPAALVSASSVVHEAADENSNAVGNLVQGNTFELIETTTSENGETWHLISMSNGVQGYISGEISTDIDSASEDEGNDTGEPEAGTAEPQDNGTESQDYINDSSGQDDADSEEGNSTPNNSQVISNTQQKTYSVKADADRIKARMQTAMEAKESLPEKTQMSVDKTFIMLLCVALISAMLLYFSCRRLKQMLLVTHKQAEHVGKAMAGHGKPGKRKKVKRAKKKRTAKEAKKWKNSSLQN